MDPASGTAATWAKAASPVRESDLAIRCRRHSRRIEDIQDSLAPVPGRARLEGFHHPASLGGAVSIEAAGPPLKLFRESLPRQAKL